MTSAALEHAIDPETWRAAAFGLGLESGIEDARLGWRGIHGGHRVAVSLTPADTARAWVDVVVADARIADSLVVTPAALALSRDGRFLTGDIALDSVVVIHGALPEVAAPWDAETRAIVRFLVSELGMTIAGSKLQLGAFGAAKAVATERVAEALNGLVKLADRLCNGAVGDQLAAIATGDPAPSVRLVYDQLLTEAASSGVLGDAAAAALFARFDEPADDAFDTLMKAARDSASGTIRTAALIKLLELFPLSKIERLLLATDDSFGVDVRDALIAAMHRETPPFSPVPLLRLMARTPLGPGGMAAAARALGASRDAAAAPRLAAMCEHPDAPVWMPALVALLNLDLPAAAILDHLDAVGRELLFERVPEVAVRERPRQAGPVLMALLERWVADESTRQIDAIGALGELQHVPARAAIAALVDAPDVTVQVAAAEALTAIPETPPLPHP